MFTENLLHIESFKTPGVKCCFTNKETAVKRG